MFNFLSFLFNSHNTLFWQSGQNKWWWYYGLKYACFWWPSNEPITNETILANITADISDSLESAVQSGALEAFAKQITGMAQLPVLGFTTNFSAMDDNATSVPPPPPEYDYPPPHPNYPPPPPRPPPPLPESSPYADSNIAMNETEKDGVFIPTIDIPDDRETPVDTHVWDWSRWFGLGIFLFTFLFTCCLIHAAAYRQQRIKEQQLWGNLGTEQGVDELLKMGWKVRGSHLEVYDKAKLGYEDDNSMLIGGFEQTSIVNALQQKEHTSPESETTPDTIHR